MKNTKQAYELTFILGEKATPEDAKKKTDSIKKLITKLEGAVTKEESWGRREMAYEIKHNRSGYYVTLWFDVPTTSLIPLERELRFDEHILRFLVTKAYTTAQPGTLYPVVEGEKEEKTEKTRTDKEDKSSAEEMLRRSSGSSAKADAKAMDDSLPEEERLEKLEVALEELLKDEE